MPNIKNRLLTHMSLKYTVQSRNSSVLARIQDDTAKRTAELLDMPVTRLLLVSYAFHMQQGHSLEPRRQVNTMHAVSSWFRWMSVVQHKTIAAVPFSPAMKSRIKDNPGQWNCNNTTEIVLVQRSICFYKSTSKFAVCGGWGRCPQANDPDLNPKLVTRKHF